MASSCGCKSGELDRRQNSHPQTDDVGTAGESSVECEATGLDCDLPQKNEAKQLPHMKPSPEPGPIDAALQ
ncbi:unnamed protein product [Protopolystoma xenopodis]|uniref:Uncharacterized protein n=1 Tax=Protopolystoma xenopodis TaxID=117903 RepID=A0A448X2I9_9PLAT|nr:unnamed protein product [Protopolystoma xenopodis]